MTPRRYAQNTTVPVERTQAEIAKLLADHGATTRGVGVDDASGRAAIMFALGGRQIRVEVKLPVAPSPPSSPKASRCKRWEEELRQEQVRRQRDQQERAVWRGLLLLIKAKLEAIKGGYTTVEHEFLADVVLPNGATVGQLVEATVEEAYISGRVPPLLPGFSDADREGDATPMLLPPSTRPRLVGGGA